MTAASNARVRSRNISRLPRQRLAGAHSNRPRTAFVLSGGASLAAAQVGMLHALYERGIEADYLVGTSAGSLNAAFVASRPQTTATAVKLGRIWRDLHREDVFPVSMSALQSCWIWPSV